MSRYPLVTILGPTASGKTKLAVALAQHIDAEIISADSRQVYKGMNIGTGKDLVEYGNVTYHLIDIIEAGQQYDIAQFQIDFQKTYKQILEKGKNAILCGGSGLYIQSVLDGYGFAFVPQNEALRAQLNELSNDDLFLKYNKTEGPAHHFAKIESHKRLIRAIEINHYFAENPSKKLPIQTVGQSHTESIIFGINLDTATRRKRITDRLKSRIENGLLEEVQSLLDTGISPEKLLYYGLEYKFCTQYFLGQLTYNELFEKLNTAIHQYAKRQMTYFRKMEKDGHQIHWIDGKLTTKDRLLNTLKILNDNYTFSR